MASKVNVAIRSDGLARLAVSMPKTPCVSSDNLLMGLSQRFNATVSRARRGDLGSWVQALDFFEQLRAWEEEVQKRVKTYAPLLQRLYGTGEPLTFSVRKKITLALGSPLHTCWLSSLNALDTLYCQLASLRAHHNTPYPKKAHFAQRQLQQVVVRRVLDWLYLPRQPWVGLQDFVNLDDTAQHIIIHRWAMPLDRLTHHARENTLLTLNEQAQALLVPVLHRHQSVLKKHATPPSEETSDEPILM